MELYKHITVTSYAHECHSINPELKEGVFKDCYYTLIDKMMFWPEIVTLVQTEQNKSKLIEKFQEYPVDLNVVAQPYPLTDSNPLNSLTKEGLLFIGRYEDRKNPAEFIKVLKAIKDKYGIEVKANVMTRAAHVKKFEADFAEIGHTNFEIVADVVGEEKAKIIQKSKVAFMPYKNESFGIAVLEALRYMPTVVLDKYDWHYNFEEFSNYIVADSKEVADIIWSAYNTWTVDELKVEKEFNDYQNNFETSLLNLLQMKKNSSLTQEPRNRLYSYLKDNKGVSISLTEYFKTQNSKGVIYLASDIESIYTSLNRYQIHHTNKDTYLGIPDDNGNCKIPEVKNTTTFNSFFD
jgi:glycosyltransferase involved in cell wall biosynthesis